MIQNSLRQTFSLYSALAKNRALTVGTLHDAVGIRILKKMGSGSAMSIDILEARLACLLHSSIPLPINWPLPVIATARHPGEGGAGNLSKSIREKLLMESIPWASGIDVELRSTRGLARVIATAHQYGRTVIVSHHDFTSTPSLSMLKKLASRASGEGADLFKVATFLRDQRDLRRLIDLQMESSAIQVSAMGMGTAGRFSRLVLAGFGAPLIYGWLGNPQVSGQWPALELPRLLLEVLPE